MSTKKPSVMLRFRTQTGLETVRRAARLADQSINKYATSRLVKIAESDLESASANPPPRVKCSRLKNLC